MDLAGHQRLPPLVESRTLFQIDLHSKILIKSDPWLTHAVDHRIPKESSIPHNMFFVKDLMTLTGDRWDIPKV